MQFVVPREPRLHWTMLCPSSRKQELPGPFSGGSSCSVFWARNALYHGLRALGVTPGDNILVPAFHCATAIEPIVKSGAVAKFYNVQRDCSPDFDDIEAKIDSNTRAVLAIHYFGFSQPIRQFQRLCKERHLYLIEDCAHVLVGEVDGTALGALGDISIFSWRKFLPIYDGGQLVINNSRLHADIPWEKSGGAMFSLKVAKNSLDKLIDDSPAKAARIMSHLLAVPYSVGRYLLSENGNDHKAFSIDNHGVDFDLSLVNRRMSSLSQYLVRNTDIHAVVEMRRANYNHLAKALEVMPTVSAFFPNLPKGICPWVFPLLVKGKPNLHLALRARGIPAFTWGGVIHPKLPLEEFPDASFLYENLVLLPVHQSIGESERRTVMEAMAEVVRSGI